MPGAAWSRFALFGLLASAVYLFLPLPVQNVLYSLVGVASVVALAVGIRRHRPSRPAPWYLLAAGVLGWVLADSATYVFYELRDLPQPFPSYVDVVYLGGYLLMMAAAALVVRRGGVPDAAAWQDAGIWVTGAFLLSWHGLLEPTATADDASLAVRVVALGYPVMDLVLLLFAVRLLTASIRRPGVFAALSVAVLCYLVSDAAFGDQVLEDAYWPGTWVDLGWLLGYVGFGAVALHPRMVELTQPQSPVPAISSGWRRLGLFVAVLLAPGLLAYQSVYAEDVDGLVIAAAARSCWPSPPCAHGAWSTGSSRRPRSCGCGNASCTGGPPPTSSPGWPTARCCWSAWRPPCSRASRSPSPCWTSTASSRCTTPSATRLVTPCCARWPSGCPRSRCPASWWPGSGATSSPSWPPPPRRASASACSWPSPHRRSSRGRPSSSAPASAWSPATAEGARSPSCCATPTSRCTSRSPPAAGVPRCTTPACRSGCCSGPPCAASSRRAWSRRSSSRTSSRSSSSSAAASSASRRWSGGTGRATPPVLPDDWIPAAEQAGLISVVDEQVLRRAVAQLVTWSRALPSAGSLTLAVNISGHTLQEVDVADRILSVLSDEGLTPNRLVLEVTEGVLIDDEAVGVRLQRLRSAGVRIALDDFGTGWSSLAYLRRFPVDVLKLDRSFVAGLGQGGSGEAVPAAVVQLAATLGLDVVAEGVETAAQADLLRCLGPMTAQGFLFGRAAPAHQLAALVACGQVTDLSSPVGVPGGVPGGVPVGVPSAS